MICYLPAYPEKSEGSGPWALYYENFLRHDEAEGRAAHIARIQHRSPNKTGEKPPNMNEVVLEECPEIGIALPLSWKLQNALCNETGEKTATFKSAYHREATKKQFTPGNIDLPLKTRTTLVAARTADADGTIDADSLTTQERKFENIYAFGDAFGFDTICTQLGADAYNPIAKHHGQQFFGGEEIKAIYDEQHSMPLNAGISTLLSQRNRLDSEAIARNQKSAKQSFREQLL